MHDSTLEENQKKAAGFLQLVIDEASRIIEGGVANYKIGFAADGRFVRREGGIVQFWTVAEGEVSPEGKTDRSCNWIGFGKVSDNILATLDEATRSSYEALIA